MRRQLWLPLLLLSVTAGCVENDVVTLYVVGNQYMDPKSECQLREQTTTLVLNPIGTMDLLVTKNYFLFPVIENGMQGLEATTGQTSDTLHLESMNVSILGAWVEFEVDGLKGPYWSKDTNKDGKLSAEENKSALSALLGTKEIPETSLYKLPGKIYVPTSGMVKLGESAPTILEVIPSYLGQYLDDDMAFDALFSGGYIRLHVTIHGVMGDGSEVKSREFSFPIYLCRGCLVSYQIDPEFCCHSSAPEVKETDLPCHLGQDDGTPCQVVCSRLMLGDLRSQAKRQMLRWKIEKLSDYDPNKDYGEIVSQQPEGNGDE